MSAKSAVSVWNCSWTTTKRSSRARPAPHRVLLGRHRRRVRVVDEERLHGRIERRVGQDAPELAHVERARARGDEVGPLEGVARPPGRCPRSRGALPPPDVAPGPHHRGQAGHRPHRHPAAGVAVQAVVEADGRGPRRGVLAGEGLDLLRPQAGRLRGARGRPLPRPLAQLLVADRVPLEPVPVLEPVAEDDVHHPEGERGVRARAGVRCGGRPSPRCASGRGRRRRAAPRAAAPPRRRARGARSS